MFWGPGKFGLKRYWVDPPPPRGTMSPFLTNFFSHGASLCLIISIHSNSKFHYHDDAHGQYPGWCRVIGMGTDIGQNCFKPLSVAIFRNE